MRPRYKQGRVLSITILRTLKLVFGIGQRPEGSITRRMQALRRINNEPGMLNLNDDFFFEGIILIKPSNHHRLQRFKPK